MEKVALQELKQRMVDITNQLKYIISEIQKEELQNTQEALNFIDDINMLSVSF